MSFAGCAALVNEMCEGKHLDLPPFTGDTLMRQFVGQNFRGIMKTLQQQYGFTLSHDETESYVRREVDNLVARIHVELEPCEGVDAVLRDVQEKYTLAVVSSSAMPRVQACINKVNQAQFFGDRVYSAATSLNPPTTKPDPAIYLHAMKELGVHASECVAIEDSRSGTLSGTRAGIKVIGYVGPYPAHEREDMAKALKDAGAVIIMDDWRDFETVLAKLEAGSV